MRIILVKGGYVAFVDEADFADLPQHAWHLCHGYARTTVDGKKKYMHHFVLQPPPGMQIDHINQNRLDNRRENLRVTDRSGNMANKAASKRSLSGQIGVYPTVCPGKPWEAVIVVGGKRHKLGTFETFEAALEARIQGEKKYLGYTLKRSDERGAIVGFNARLL